MKTAGAGAHTVTFSQDFGSEWGLRVDDPRARAADRRARQSLWSRAFIEASSVGPLASWESSWRSRAPCWGETGTRNGYQLPASASAEATESAA